MLDSVLQLVLQLPVGLLLAAGLMEIFILWKDRRELEPAVLWLLFCACVTGLLCGGIHFLLKGTADYALWAGLGSGAAAAGFWLRRQMRNRGVAKLNDRFYPPNSYAPVKMPGQDGFILGYRIALVAAVALTLLGLHFGGIMSGAGLNASEKWAKLTAGDGKAETAGVAATPGNPPPAAPPAAAPPGEGSPSVAATPPAAPPNNGDPSAVPATPPANPAAPPDPTAAPGTSPPQPPPSTAQNPPPATPGDAATPPAPTPAPAPASPVTTPPAPGTPAAPAGSPTPAAPGTPPGEAAPAAMSADARPISRNSIFMQRIMPILRRACTECHGSSKQKGDCRVDQPGFIRGDNGGNALVLAGKPESSPLYQVIAKPADDEDRMPPAKKGPPLPRQDIELIRKWIEAGADMGDGVSAASSAGVKFATDDLAAKLTPPPAALIEQLKGEGAVTRAISKDGKLLELDMSHTDYPPGGIHLERLAPIAHNIHALDLSRTHVSDADLAHLASMTNLTRLLLSRTEITDAALAHLKTLTKLEHLNLYQTKVTDSGLQHLSGLKNLKKLYTWQSQVTDGGASALVAQIPGLVVNTGN